MQSIRRSLLTALQIDVRAFASEASTSQTGGVGYEGVKSIVKSILDGAEAPMTSAQIWEQAETRNVRSKRHMKQMLQQMKKASEVKTICLESGKRSKQFGFRLAQDKPKKATTTTTLKAEVTAES